jgi:hypothetical protein
MSTSRNVRQEPTAENFKSENLTEKTEKTKRGRYSLQQLNNKAQYSAAGGSPLPRIYLFMERISPCRAFRELLTPTDHPETPPRPSKHLQALS